MTTEDTYVHSPDLTEWTVVMPYGERAAKALIEHAAPMGARLARGASSQGISHAARSVIVPPGAAGAFRALATRLLPHRFSLLPMHVAKQSFTTLAAQRLDNVVNVIGFPGAAKEVFDRARGRRVLHAVDAHPREHNAALLRHHRRARVAAEIYPEWLIQRIERELELATEVLTPSDLVADQMMSRGIPSEKILVIPYGVDVSTFSGRASAARTAGRPRALYVGQISRRKGIDFLIDSARGLSIDVTLVGNVFDRRLLRNMPGNVRHVAAMPHEELRAKYLEADVFVLPTLEDACALVTFEAAASGLPIISTPMNGATERLPRQSLTLVAPGDADDLRVALRGVASLDQATRGHNADIFRTSGLDWTAYAQEVWRVLA